MIDEILNKLEKEDKKFRLTHTINSSDLMKSLKDYEGLLAPSLALLKTTEFLSQYGEAIVVLEPKSLFNGGIGCYSSDTVNYVFNGDMYSPRFPKVEYDYNSKEEKHLINLVNDYSVKYKDPLYRIGSHDLKSPKNMEKYLKESPSVKMHFINKHENFDFKLKETKIKESSPFNDDLIFKKFIAKINFGENISEQMKIEIDSAYSRSLEALDNQDLNERVLSRKKKNLKNEYEEMFQEPIEKETGVSFRAEDNLKKIKRSIISPSYKVDVKHRNNKINRKLSSLKIEDEFELFCEDLAALFFENPHYEYGRQKLECTEENILKIMKKEGAISSEKTLSESLGKTKSKTLSRILSLEDLFDRACVDLSTKKEFEREEEKTSILFDKVRGKVIDLNFDNDVFETNNFVSMSLSRGYKNNEDIISYYKMNKYTINEEVAKDLLSLRSMLISTKSPYFEAKPFRKINKEEIKCVVLPRNAPKELKELLKEQGIKTSYYQLRNQEDLQRAIDKTDKYLLTEDYIKREKELINKKRQKQKTKRKIK